MKKILLFLPLCIFSSSVFSCEKDSWISAMGPDTVYELCIIAERYAQERMAKEAAEAEANRQRQLALEQAGREQAKREQEEAQRRSQEEAAKQAQAAAALAAQQAAEAKKTPEEKKKDCDIKAAENNIFNKQCIKDANDFFSMLEARCNHVPTESYKEIGPGITIDAKMITVNMNGKVYELYNPQAGCLRGAASGRTQKIDVCEIAIAKQDLVAVQTGCK